MNSPFDTFAGLQSEEGKLLAGVASERAGEAPDLVAGHTPTPWRLVDADDSPDERSIRAGADWRVCTVHGYCGANDVTVDNEESEANARLIVNAVNSHEAVLTAARAALKYVDNLNEDTPVDLECKECVGRVFFTRGTPEPPLCWIHQLEKIVKKEGK